MRRRYWQWRLRRNADARRDLRAGIRRYQRHGIPAALYRAEQAELWRLTRKQLKIQSHLTRPPDPVRVRRTTR